MAFTLSSPAFNSNTNLPSQFTCEGENVSPPLRWEEAPDNTRSFALIVDDPDAPSGTWVHWTLFNIPPDVYQIEQDNTPPEAISGLNSWGETGYRGPCPPSGTHHYYFKLYALDKTLSLSSNVTSEEILDAMQGHILDECVLIGLYSNPS
ncbi:YbhB/YbcL family Raf kinase inhibitor-like protein [Legionella londiniensis]|uniref:Phosphatidylethanolamine-binding protein PebP n=1 Tax=Legionella londiniensis TaxID=45068 RepID=A0A0W0VM82_9GAMM|nr:YbhB/YbcL family Raf kinase inhibitor-like protein [Legionella londiniensis]KTD21259.1 phosphatidylethanolamine-binding protein PebP [Legionella londiniensis]STX93285.1 phosphatidylethanolamine-binding protein PebP [Legionella londiniensis]